MYESNCLFCTRDSFEKIGRADERFDLPGGGSVNIHIYSKLAALPESKLVVLAGEGSFHQFHGGVTTAEVEEREDGARAPSPTASGDQRRHVRRRAPRAQVLGVIPSQAQEFVKTLGKLRGVPRRCLQKARLARVARAQTDFEWVSTFRASSDLLARS